MVWNRNGRSWLVHKLLIASFIFIIEYIRGNQPGKRKDIQCHHHERLLCSRQELEVKDIWNMDETGIRMEQGRDRERSLTKEENKWTSSHLQKGELLWEWLVLCLLLTATFHNFSSFQESITRNISWKIHHLASGCMKEDIATHGTTMLSFPPNCSI